MWTLLAARNRCLRMKGLWRCHQQAPQEEQVHTGNTASFPLTREQRDNLTPKSKRTPGRPGVGAIEDQAGSSNTASQGGGWPRQNEGCYLTNCGSHVSSICAAMKGIECPNTVPPEYQRYEDLGGLPTQSAWRPERMGRLWFSYQTYHVPREIYGDTEFRSRLYRTMRLQTSCRLGI